MTVPGPRAWPAIAVGITGVLVLTVAATLLARVDDIDDHAMSIAGTATVAHAVPLLETAGPPPPVYVLRMETDDSTSLLAFQELRILFHTGGSHVRLVKATFDIRGIACPFHTPAGASLADNTLVRFVRALDCRAAGTPTGELRLTVHLSDRAPVGVWTWAGDARGETTSPLIRVIGIPGHSGPAPLLRGRYVTRTQPSDQRRIDLLNYLWQVSPSTTWLWVALLVAGLCVMTGGVLLGTTAVATPLTAAISACAMFLLTAGICGGYALLTPPFQAADEPDHLLGFARLTGDAALATQAEAWARLGHFERIKFRSDERFRPQNVGQPFPIAWSHETFAEDVTARSTTTTRWWRLLARMTSGESAQRQLLTVRLANVLLFALSTSLATVVLRLTAATAVAQPQWLSGIFLLLPILPFFAMPVSEFAVLVSIYVLLAACLLGLFVDSGRSYWLGAPLGLTTALMAVSGRSGLPMLSLVAAALLARSLLGQRDPLPTSAHRRHALWFWGGFSMAFTTVTLLLRAEYARPVDSFAAIAQNTLLPVFRWVWDTPLVMLALGAAALATELLILHVRRALSTALVSRFDAAVAWACYVAAAAVLGLFAGSSLVEYPHLDQMRLPPQWSAVEYIQQVLAVVFTTFRLSEPDLLLVTSFVAGFGWVDTIPDGLIVRSIVVAVGAATIALLMVLARRRDTRRALWLVAIGCGFTTSLALYAVATHGMSRNLYGRYLIGVYLCLLALLTSVPSLVRWPRLERWLPLPAALLIAAITIHAYCFRLILTRYF